MYSFSLNEKRKSCKENQFNNHPLLTNNLASMKLLVTKSTVSISNLMDRFTLRRQHSDSNLKRLFLSENLNTANTLSYNADSTKDFISSSDLSVRNTLPTKIKHVDNKNLKCIPNRTDIGTTLIKKTFKWRSLFSANKVGTVTNDLGNITINKNKKKNCEKNLISSMNSTMSTKKLLKKSISLNYSLPNNKLSSQILSRSNTLSPLIEDTNTFSDEYQLKNKENETNKLNSVIKFRLCNRKNQSNIKKSQEHKERPFSVICSSEHDNLMLQLRNYQIDKESDRKFTEFLKIQSELKTLNINENDEDKLNYYRNSLLEEKMETQSINSCCEQKKLNLYESFNLFDKFLVLNKENLDKDFDTKHFLFTCSKHRLRRNSSEKQSFIYKNLESPSYSALLTLNYNSLNRNLMRRNFNSVSNNSSLLNRKNFCLPSYTVLKQKRSFSPTCQSPCNAISPKVNNASSAGRIQKRRNIPANRRRSNININQVLIAYNSPMQLTKKENDIENNENKLAEKSEQKIVEETSLDAFKAVILHHHSLQKAVKPLEVSNSTSNLIWRKVDR